MKLPVCLLLATAAMYAQPRRPVIAIGGIIHETNTFNPRKTHLADFETGIGASGMLRGEAILREHELASSTFSGFIEGARLYGLDLVPAVTTGVQTIGIVTAEAFNTIMGELVERLKAAPRLDGVLLMLHGTMVVEGYPHGDAEAVRRVRQAFGPKRVPVVVVHDYHANVSEEIVALTDALITYKECPHLDAKDRGVQAARVMAGIVSGKVKPVQAMVKPPMLLNLVFQNTFAAPLKAVVDESKKLERNPKILAVSVPGGYQWADIPAMGPSAVVVTDNDPELARREAQKLADMLWALRGQLKLALPDPAAAVKQAMSSTAFPVVLMDTGDNIGGGSSGDSTFLLAELLRQKAEGWVVVLADAEAAGAAFRAGVGGAFDQPVGGKTDKLHGEPVRLRGRVKALYDGKFVEPEVRHGGVRYWDMGHTAVIEAEGSTRDLPNVLILTPKRVIPFSLHQLTSAGVYPQRQKILVVKGTIAPRAAYEPVAARIIEVDTGGVTAVNPARFTYHHVRRPLFGLE